MTLSPPRVPGEWRQRIRSLVRRSEFLLVVVAAGIGCTVAMAVVAMTRVAHLTHYILFGVALDKGLSAATYLPPYSFLVPATGGLLLGAIAYWMRSRKMRVAVDPIEANALHGGVMSTRDSLLVAGQTVLSNGVGASVGLEAGYTQIGGAFASRAGRALRLRRQDMRVLVGCGTAAAISAAFNAPIAGGFYAFELIIGAYSIATAAPVMVAAFSAMLVTNGLGGVTLPLQFDPLPAVTTTDFPLYILLGTIAGFVGIVIMRGVSLVERWVGYTRIPMLLRPAFGGGLLGLMAFITPQVLSAGHGALLIELNSQTPLVILAGVFLLKSLAAAICLGCGFRGGLFFASLFLGALLGKLFGGLILLAWPAFGIHINTSAFVGMSALAVAVVGGPMTMSFLTLETTSSIGVSSLALCAAIASSMIVREFFGYSFSTWRLHLRGETIRSPYDVGWIRNLTVGRMMRPTSRTARIDMPMEAFRKAFPLGSATRAIVLDAKDRYVGIASVAQAHAAGSDGGADAHTIADIVSFRDQVLLPSMNVKEAMAAFDAAETDALAVIDNLADRKVLGELTEAYALRRYSEELDQARQGIAGDVGS